jgi:hypothetical protein
VLAGVAPGLTLQPLTSGRVAPPAGHGIDAASVKLLSNAGPPTAASDIAAAEAGFYSCSWLGTTGSIVGVKLSVLPGGAQFVSADKADAASYAAGSQLPHIAVGDDSFSFCSETDALYGCELEFTDDGLAIAIQLFEGKTTPTQQQYVDGLTALANSVMERIGATESTPKAAAAPSSRWTGTSDCTRIETALAPQFPGLKLEYGQLDGTDNYTPLFGGALQLGGFACWPGRTGPVIFVVPGAASWAWAAPFDPSVKVTQLSTAGLPGLAAARFGTWGPGNSWVDGIIDGAIVTLNADSAADGLKALAAIAAG